jgi:hypothetical protein
MDERSAGVVAATYLAIRSRWIDRERLCEQYELRSAATALFRVFSAQRPICALDGEALVAVAGAACEHERGDSA